MNVLSGFKIYYTTYEFEEGRLEVFFIIFRYLFPKLANDLDIVISYIGITLQEVTIQKFLILVFDTEIGRLCAFKLVRTPLNVLLRGF